MFNILNYKDMSFSYYRDGSDDYSKFSILTCSFLDYHYDIVAITISQQQVGSKTVWLAKFTHLTTEYSGSLAEVIEKCYQHYQQNSIHNHKEEENV